MKVLFAALLLCLGYTASLATDGREVARKALAAIENSKLTRMGAQPCRIDLEVKESVIVNGAEQKDQTKISSSYFLQKNLLDYKMKIDENQEIVHFDYKSFVADASKQAVELPDSLAHFMEKMISLFDAYNASYYYAGTIPSTCALLAPANADGRECHVLEFSNPGSQDTTIFFVDKETYQTKQALLKMTVEGQNGTITFQYDYTLGENLGIIQTVQIQNEEQGRISLTTFSTKIFEIIDKLSDDEFKYEVIKGE